MGGFSPVGLLGLQRAAGNAATIAAVQRASAAPGIDEVVEQIAQSIPAKRNMAVYRHLQLEVGRIDLLDARYRELKGRTIRDDLLATNSRDDGFVKCLALLHAPGNRGAADEPWAQLGMVLIPPGTADTLLVNILYEHDLAGRKRLADTYATAFRGVRMGGGDTLYHHIVDDTSGWRRDKCLFMLQRELTDADKLHFETTGIVGTHDEEAIKILQGVWERGPAAFQQLEHDWENQLHKGGWVEGTLYESMHKEFLFGQTRQVFDSMWRAYKKSQPTGVVDDATAITEEQEHFTSAMFVKSFSRDVKGLVRASSKMREAWERKIKKDPAAAAEWTASQAHYLSWAEKALGNKVFGDRADAVEVKINLLRTPSSLDEIWMAMHRADDQGVLDRAQEAWMEGAEGTLEQQAMHPPEGDPRPKFSVIGQAIPTGNPLYPHLRALVDPGLDHAGRGAQLLSLYLGGQATSTAAADLGAASKLLKALRQGDQRLKRKRPPDDPGLLDQVIEKYALEHLKKTPGKTPTEALVNHLRGRFDDSPSLVDLAQLLLPDQTLDEHLTRAEARRRSTQTGWASGAALELVYAYDDVTGEHTMEAEDASLRRLRRWTSLSHTSPDELKAVMALEGVESPDQLARRGYEQYKSRLDEVRSVKSAMADAVDTVISFAGRSVLVAILGPAGLPGLISALAAYTTAMVAHEGLLGEEYQLWDMKNVSTLMGEVATFGFDEFMVASAISELTNPTVNRAIDAVTAQSRSSKFAEEFGKQLASKTVEKIIQDAIEGETFPMPSDIEARAIHAMAAAGGKTGSMKLPKPTVFESRWKRYVKNFKSIAQNGPPPKAALTYAVAKEATDTFVKGSPGNLSGPEIVGRHVKAGVVSIASALPVAGAFNVVQGRDAARARRLGAQDPRIVRVKQVEAEVSRLRNNPKVLDAYEAFNAPFRASRAAALPFNEWIGQVAAHGGKASFTDAAGTKVEVDLNKELYGTKAQSDVLKDMDEVMTPHSKRRWG